MSISLPSVRLLSRSTPPCLSLHLQPLPFKVTFFSFVLELVLQLQLVSAFSVTLTIPVAASKNVVIVHVTVCLFSSFHKFDGYPSPPLLFSPNVSPLLFPIVHFLFSAENRAFVGSRDTWHVPRYPKSTASSVAFAPMWPSTQVAADDDGALTVGCRAYTCNQNSRPQVC